MVFDQDDVWYPEKISVMSAMLDAEPEIDGVFCNSRLVDENLSGTGKSLFELRGFSRRMQKHSAYRISTATPRPAVSGSRPTAASTTTRTRTVCCLRSRPT